MNKNELISILGDWNFWGRDIFPDTGFTRRNYLDRMERLLNSGQVVVITGARRSGKSFIMRQLAVRLLEKDINKAHTLIVNFEDPRFENLDVKLLQKIYETYLEFIRPSVKPYIFLDEIQEVAQWEKWVRTMHELGKAHIIVSGSNARLLSRELATVLTGRHLDITVFPLSFSEFLEFKGINTTGVNEALLAGIEMKQFLREYIESGSFPKVVLERDKQSLLLAYFDDVINKDLVKRFKIRKAEKIKALAKFYLSNISSPVTYTSSAKFLHITNDTVEKFSGYLEAAYLNFFLKRFSFTVKEQEKSPRKVYSIDTGLANTVGFRFSGNWGRAAENAVFIELKRRAEAVPGMEIYYWKNERHQEVDFVIKEEVNSYRLTQVCWDVNDIKTRKREISSLEKASVEFRLKTAEVITEDYEGEEKTGTLRVRFIPLLKWLVST